MNNSRYGEMLLIGGNANPRLSIDIAKQLGQPLVNATIGIFPDSETNVEIHDDIREQDVFILQPTCANPELGLSSNDSLMEACIIADALRRASAARITLIAPYFGYARSDRKDDSRKPIVAKVAANLYNASGVNRMLAVDLHSPQIQGFTDLPFDHVYARKPIAAAIRERGLADAVIVAPDIGAGKMAEGMANRLATDWAVIGKRRINSETVETSFVAGNVKGRDVLLIDDMVATAGSLGTAAMTLLDNGANRVSAVATHGVFCGDAYNNIDNSLLDWVGVTDTVPEDVNASSKIYRITLAPLLAECILNIHSGKSVSQLF